MESTDKNKKIKQRKIFKATMIIVALFSAAFFSYLLIMPAITMVAQPICGDENHLHTQECFDQPVEIGFICGKEEHVHSEECFDENGNLICLKEEHTHTGQCIEAHIIQDKNTVIENLFHGKVDVEEVDLPETISTEENSETFQEEVAEEENKEINQQTFEENPSSEVLDDNSPKAMLRASKAPQKSEKYDFKDWITNVSLQVANDGKNFIDYTGDMPLYSWQQLKFSFDYEVPANTLSSINKVIYYQLPYNITVFQEENGKVFNKAGKIIGDYTIDQSGVITVEFYEEFANKNFEGDVIYGSINFASEISSFETNKDGSVDFIFKDDMQITIVVADKSDKTGDLYIEKTQSNLKEGKYIDYKITVWSNEGTSDVVNLLDTMSNVKYSNNLRIHDQNGNRLNINMPQNGDKSFSYTLPKLPKNGKYIIEYTSVISDDFTYSTYLNNQVSASSKDSEGNEIEAQTAVSLFYSVNVVSKNGVITDNDTIKWTVNINDDHLNIGGFTLTDYFNNEKLEKTVALIKENEKRTVTLPYTFGTNDTNSYVLEYETPREKMYGSNSAYNKISLQKGDVVYSDEKYVFIGQAQPPTVEKTALGVELNDNKEATLYWHIHIESGDSIPSGKMLSDFLSDNQYFTCSQARSYLKNFDDLGIKYTAKFYGPGGWWPEYDSLSENEKYGSIRLTLTKPIPANTVIDFDYKTSAYITDTSTVTDFENSFSVDYITNTVKNSFTPSIRKYDPLSNENPSSHILTEDRLITWEVLFTVPEESFNIREILPKDVSLYRLELQGEEINREINDDNEAILTFDDNFVNKYKNSKQILRVIVKINDDVEWEKENSKIKKKSFENKINLEKDGQVIDSSSHTQIIKQVEDSYEERIIQKSYNGVSMTDNLPYTLDINPNGRDLLDKGDVLSVTDNMTYWGNSEEVLLYLAKDSVTAYEVNEDGSTRLLSDDEFLFAYDFDISAAAGKWGNCYNTLKLKIPDKMHIRIDYMYRVNGKKDGEKWYQFSNSATIEEVVNSQPSVQESISISINSSSVVADTGDLKIYKIDSKTSEILPGVYFKVYKYNNNSYELVTENGNDLYVTNSEGFIELKNAEFNTAYKLEEIAPLENYLNIEPMYFMVYNDDLTLYPYNKPDDFDGIIYRTGMDVFVKNEKPVTSVHVKKKWTDGNGIEDGVKGDLAQINLFRVVQNKDDYNHGISDSGTISLTTKYMPNQWSTWDDYTETSEYAAGTKLKLNIRCTNQWYTPENIVVNYNGNTLGGSKNAVYVEKVHEYYTENVLQYTDYTYEFTADSTGELLVNLNYSSLSDLAFDLTATSVPAQDSPDDEKFSEAPYKTIILNEINDFEYTWENLPLIGTDEEGNLVHYFYYITESPISGYACEIQALEKGDDGYDFLVINKRITKPSYNMPATGGFGVYHVYAIGIILIVFALIMIFKKR